MKMGGREALGPIARCADQPWPGCGSQQPGRPRGPETRQSRTVRQACQALTEGLGRGQDGGRRGRRLTAQIKRFTDQLKPTAAGVVAKAGTQAAASAKAA